MAVSCNFGQEKLAWKVINGSQFGIWRGSRILDVPEKPTGEGGGRSEHFGRRLKGVCLIEYWSAAKMMKRKIWR